MVPTAITIRQRDSDYAMAARSEDGSLVVIYTPTNHPLGVDMTRLAGSATARWFDPTAGTYTTISGSPFPNMGSMEFTPYGNNAVGEGDWVLVLETQPVVTEPLAVTITSPFPGLVVSNLVTLAATATAAEGLAGVLFMVDGVIVGRVTSSEPYEVVWDSITVSNGMHAVQALAWDKRATWPATTLRCS